MSLPRVRSRFFGRSREIGEVRGALGRGRFVSIVGAPGMGKTRLAREVAAGAAEAIWASAAGAETEAQLVARVALALATSAEDASAVALALTEQSARVPGSLLVIDDLDHAAASAGPFLEACVAAAPDLLLLVTSRVRVRSEREDVVALGPLDVDTAVDVFVDRAGADASPRSRDEIAELVEKVDRVPFAIELLAGCARVVGAAELDARVGAALESRSLSDAIERSFRALDPAAARALLVASVFQGGFSLEAFESVVAPLLPPGAPASLDVLRALVDSSLVAATEDPDAAGAARFLLYESIRVFAWERLADRDAVRAASRAHFLPLAAELARAARRPSGAVALQRLALESANISAACEEVAPTASSAPELAEAVLALDLLARARGSVSASAARLSRAIEWFLPDARLHARLVLARAHASTRLGRVPDALRDLAQAQRIVDATGFGDVESELLSELTVLMQSFGQIDEALELLERRAEVDQNRDLLLRSLGVLFFSRGDLEKASVVLERALAEAQRAGNENHAATIEALLAMVRHEIGDVREARALFERSRDRARAIGDRFTEAAAQNWFGQFLFDVGERAEGRRAVAEARATLDELGDVWFSRATLGYLGIFAHFDGDLPAARALLEDAVARARLGQDHYRLGHFLPHLGAVLASTGDEAGARAALAEARELVAGSPCPNLPPITAALESFVDRAGAPRHLARASRHAPRSSDVRLAMRLVEARLGLVPTSSEGPKLVVARGYEWFVGPGGARADLSRRIPLQRLLACLVASRREGVSSERLVAAGWPGERISRDAALHRVHVAVATLRRLGLGDALLKRSDGYLLDPSITVTVGDG